MSFKSWLGRIGQYIMEHRSGFYYSSAAILLVAAYLYIKGIVIEAVIPTQSAFGFSSITINAGAMVAIIGGAIMLAGLMIGRSSNKGRGLWLLGLITVIAGAAIAGGNVLGAIFGFFQAFGILGVWLGILIVIGVILQTAKSIR